MIQPTPSSTPKIDSLVEIRAAEWTAEFRRQLSEPVRAEDLLLDLVPPHHFQDARFSNYVPDARWPSQESAKRTIEQFVTEAGKRKRSFSWLLPKTAYSERGLYLDGGFGVGKTHLLASAYHAFDGLKAYLSFQELMFLVGLLKLEKTARTLSKYSLLLIDEFELDDPGNTRIITNLLGKLFDQDVRVITTSNTPPRALGDGKFSVEDFKRELGQMSSSFKIITINGEDFRTTHAQQFSGKTTWVADLSLSPAHERMPVVTFKDLLDSLSLAHPMRVRKALKDIDALIILNLQTIQHPHEALRFVYFVDKAYDNDIQLTIICDIAIDDLFHPSYLRGGDTKKYRRALSRLHEMTHRLA